MIESIPVHIEQKVEVKMDYILEAIKSFPPAQKYNVIATILASMDKEEVSQMGLLQRKFAASFLRNTADMVDPEKVVESDYEIGSQ